MTTDAKSDERRQFERNPLTIEVRFDGGSITGTATTRDIGLGGLYLATNENLPNHSQLSLNLRFDDAHELIIKGVVVYQEPGEGVGIRFQDLSEDDELILRRQLPEIETASVKIGRQ